MNSTIVPRVTLQGETINISDGNIGYSFTADAFLDVMRSREKNLRTIDQLERQVNAREPVRFLPRLIQGLEEHAAAAMNRGDTPRGEAYAAAALLIRGKLVEDSLR